MTRPRTLSGDAGGRAERDARRDGARGRSDARRLVSRPVTAASHAAFSACQRTGRPTTWRGEGVRGKERSTRQNHEEPVPLAPGKAASRLPLSFIFLLRGQQATHAWETGKTPFRGHEALGSPKQACLVVRVTERARRESDQRLAV